MAKVVLHIGTHKTATTTIQDMFAFNAELLCEHGLIYPILGRASGHHGLAMDWNRLPAIYELPGGSLANLREISETHGAGDHTVFLSSEELSRGADAARVDFTAVRDALSGFDQIEVICVLREQWQFIQSIYLEVSKTRVPPRPPVFVETVLRDNMVEGLWTDYTLIYDHLLTAFQPSQITFFDFDTCRRAEGGILGHLLRHMGIGLDAGALDLVHGGQSNTSPKPLPAWAANVIAEPRVAPKWLIEATQGAFAAQFGQVARSFLWTREEFRTLRDYARVNNSRLSERLIADTANRPLTYVPHVTNQREDDIYREDLRADFWLRANRWLFGSVLKDKP